MPVQLTLTIPDLPIPPTGYLLVAMEIRDREPRDRPAPERALQPHTTEGYEKASRYYLERSREFVRLVSVAWFANRPLDECRDGDERLVSVFDGQTWGEWTAEPIVQSRDNKAPRVRKGLCRRSETPVNENSNTKGEAA